jgi:hypothetical protein
MTRGSVGDGVTDTRLCLPSVHICDPRPILVLECAEIPERVVTFASQDTQIVLGLVESCASPMLVSAQLEMVILSEGTGGMCNMDVRQRRSLERTV